jgi:histidinol-phosphate/aromatic aminotransferase/cobyric acid decarboxylase-like protein
MAVTAFDDMDQLMSQARAQEVMDRQIKADGLHPNALDRADERDDIVFISDWNGEHPFVPSFLDGFASRTVASLGSLTRYSHLEEDTALEDKLRRLHRDRYAEPGAGEVGYLPGAGSASFLTTMLFRSKQLGFDRLCYLPPVYNSAIYLIQEMGFAVRKGARDVDFAEDPGLDLPDARCVLWFTDPVWFAGRPVRQETVDEIARWQRRTGSMVLVDGTFQYQRWDGARFERSSGLDPRLTYRLVCPTKALAIHGFRFAYLIVPRAELPAVTELHSRLHGAAGVADRAFAHRAVATLDSDTGNRQLIDYARHRYEALIAAGGLREWLEPASGYFVFGKPATTPETVRGMGPECFEVRGHPGYLRVNLLSDRAVRHLCARASVAGSAGGRA